MSATANGGHQFPPKHCVGFSGPGKAVIHLRAKICLVPTYQQAMAIAVPFTQPRAWRRSQN